jgi:hypothetical protein
MSDTVRILLRVTGLVLFFGSLAAIAYIVGVGPNDVGHQMGRSCRHATTKASGPAEWCTWQDVLGLMQALPWIMLIGAVLFIVGRPERSGTPTLSLGGSSPAGTTARPRFNAIRTAGTLAVIGITVFSLAGVFVYRWSYRVAHGVEMTKKVLNTPRPDVKRPKAVKPAATAPTGLAKGSLLRTDGFRKGIAEIRHTAGGGRLAKLRVAADSIDADVLAGRRVLSIHKAWNAKAKVTATVAATDGAKTLITFAALDPAAPQRIVAKTGVDYLVLFDAVGLRWNGFETNGTGQVTASPDGRHLR